MDGEAILNELDRTLKVSDKHFLRAIRDINNAPTQYDGTDRGEVPANKPLITEVSGLSKSAVEYRLGDSDLDEDGLGLITVHPPTVNGRRFGPKSAELTRKGMKVLSALEDQEDEPVDGVDQESIKQLRARVNALENTEFESGDDVSAGEVLSELSQLHQRLDEVETMMDKKFDQLDERVDAVESNAGSEWGAVDESTATDVDRVLNMAPALMLVWSEVLGIDIPEVVQKDSVSNEEIMEYRRHALETLREGIEASDDAVASDTPATASPTGGSELSDVSGGSDEPAQGQASGQATIDEAPAVDAEDGESGETASQQETDISRPDTQAE